jgi:hypothetical protein
MRSIHITYGRSTVGSGTILSSMFSKCGITDKYADADFSLPIPDEWLRPVDGMIASWGSGKPILVYRPLVARPEWRGSIVRNANVDDYAAVFAAIRDEFFVVSVADLEPGREWIVGPILRPDVTLHQGELPFESLAALFRRARCVFTSSGFGAVLAPAVGTPCISIQGGFEPAQWHADGAKHAPLLGIDPVKPCACATSACTNPCDKKLDVPSAQAAVRDFVSAHCGVSAFAEIRPIAEMFAPAEFIGSPKTPPHTLRQIQPRIGHPSLINRRPGVRA